MSKRVLFSIVIVAVLLFSYYPVNAASTKGMIGVNVLLNTPVTKQILTGLSTYGRVRDVVFEIQAVTMQIKTTNLAKLRALKFVESVSPDAVRNGSPVDTVTVENFNEGLSTWDLDAINVTELGTLDRQVAYDGTGVYVAVLDTGLLDSWRQYFPEERIAVEYGIAFGGGGGEVGFVSSQPLKLEHDQNSHGTHVTSTILGYSFFGTPVNGVAPMATVIPVKVLNQNGSGWSSVIARGIVYVADLKAGPLADFPVVINMSLGGPALDAMEKAAIDYAISKGVIIVASAGNKDVDGMGYPGAYEPVISVAASGWVGEWAPWGNGSWWWNVDVPDPTNPADYYITDFSSRELAGQDLDVAAPGSWVLGPYQMQSGQISYYYLGGTSMASPHVAGIAALMVQKNPTLQQTDIESLMEGAAIALPAGCRDVLDPFLADEVTYCWEADATGAGLLTADAALAVVP